LQQQHYQHQQQQQEEVTLPPLSAFPPQKQKVKVASSANRRSGVAVPGVLKQQAIEKRRRPYK
jgi:hypothetical protein